MRHFAVVTDDRDTDGGALIAWHRGRQGTVEHARRILRDELAAGVYPSARHGANAAWLRLQVLTLDLLELLRAVALDPELRDARPRRPRFRVFTAFGRAVDHARTSFIRVASGVLADLTTRPPRPPATGGAITPGSSRGPSRSADASLTPMPSPGSGHDPTRDSGPGRVVDSIS